jgi:hypothetical protein
MNSAHIPPSMKWVYDVSDAFAVLHHCKSDIYSLW